MVDLPHFLHGYSPVLVLSSGESGFIAAGFAGEPLKAAFEVGFQSQFADIYGTRECLADIDPSMSPRNLLPIQGNLIGMVRNYQPRNFLDPGSKLAPGKTRVLIYYILAGRPSAWIAKKESVSKNTVSSVSAKFRRKLRTSASVRQACYEVFYEHRFLHREEYVHFLDGPEALRPGYFADVANCVFQCPSQFNLSPTNWPRFIFATDRRVLNLRQSQRFLELKIGDIGFFVRKACEGCRAIADNPINAPEFYVLYNVYLRARNLRAEHVEEYYYLFAVFFMLHMVSINLAGVRWSGDEILFPDEKEWDQLPQRYVASMREILDNLVPYITGFLENDPLS